MNIHAALFHISCIILNLACVNRYEISQTDFLNKCKFEIIASNTLEKEMDQHGD